MGGRTRPGRREHGAHGDEQGRAGHEGHRHPGDPPDAAGPASEEGDEHWSRPRPGRRALLLDVGSGLLAAAVCLLGLGLTRAVAEQGGGTAVGPGGPLPPEDVAWTLLVALPLCARRVLPVTAMLVSTGAFVVLGSRSPMSAASFTLNLVLFLVLLSGTAWGRHRGRVALAWALVLVGMVVWYVAGLLGVVSDGLPPAGAGVVALTALVNVLYFSGALLGGRALWRAARDRDRLRRVADRLRAEQERSARQAVVGERLRIARELHDVVAHHVSTTGVQAAAARRVLERSADGPGGTPAQDAVARASAALREAEAASRSAVAEMRALLGVLRAPDDAEPALGACPSAPELPQPGVDDLDALLERVRSRGLAVRLSVVGVPRPLPATTGTTLHRLVQEALANAERHSAAREVRVVVRWPDVDGRGPGAGGGAGAPRPDGSVEVEVLDDGPARRGTAGTGLGHTGMQERAALVGGAVEVGSRPGGGYRVRARYPLAGPAVRP
ncbi:histidine kinase [Pseudokineococcus basanitobsidens]|uniref:histidine kinase n=1 Tax=Pseudokineococcus basanitobsidens TaxID=1926649 RepID=A0ABU8RJX0_9ACTN